RRHRYARQAGSRAPAPPDSAATAPGRCLAPDLRQRRVRDTERMTDACRAVLFDLDDTLLDGDAAWRAGVGKLLARCPQVAHDVAISAWETAFHEHFPPFLAGELTQ